MNEQLVFGLGVIAYGCAGQAFMATEGTLRETASYVCEAAPELDALRVTRPAAFAMILSVSYVICIAVWPVLAAYAVYRWASDRVFAFRHRNCHPGCEECVCDCERCTGGIAVAETATNTTS